MTLQNKLIPIAISSQFDTTGAERIHMARFNPLAREAYVLPPSPPRGVVFNSYDDTLTVFDAATYAVVGSVALPGGAGSNVTTDRYTPYVTNDGMYCYLSKRNGTVYKINLATMTIVWAAAREGNNPTVFSMNEAENKLYMGGGIGSNSLVVLDLLTQTYTTHTITGIVDPWGVSLDEEGGCLYLGGRSPGAFNLCKIDLNNFSVLSSRSGIGDGYLFFHNAPISRVLVCDATDDGVIWKLEDTLLASSGSVGNPGIETHGFIPSLDGSIIYKLGYFTGTNYRVYKTETATGNIVNSLTFTNALYPGMCLSNDGTRLFVTISDFTAGIGTADYTSIIDTATMLEVTQIPCGANPNGVGIPGGYYP